MPHNFLPENGTIRWRYVFIALIGIGGAISDVDTLSLSMLIMVLLFAAILSDEKEEADAQRFHQWKNEAAEKARAAASPKAKPKKAIANAKAKADSKAYFKGPAAHFTIVDTEDSPEARARAEIARTIVYGVNPGITPEARAEAKAKAEARATADAEARDRARARVAARAKAKAKAYFAGLESK